MPETAGPASRSVIERYRSVRAATVGLCSPLETDDYQLQPMPDASPPKWHLAHTTWFFEEFVLARFAPGYRRFDPRFGSLFNSYYEALGPRHPRPARGLLSRPTVGEVLRYRDSVDEAMVRWLTAAPAYDEALIELGLNHEQQHQELILTDLKAGFAKNPLLPTYRAADPAPGGRSAPAGWVEYPGGLVEVGHEGNGFAFDNEGPRHRVYLRPYALASRLVTAGEFQNFLSDGGYDRPELWLSDGWAARNRLGWERPEYWLPTDNGTHDQFTLSGVRPVESDEPVVHVSYYEADAFARWAGCRLATEHEWELAAREHAAEAGHFADEAVFHPRPAVHPTGGIAQLFGDCWEWTASPYVAYPGFRPAPGALGEYNGKFMCNQMVLRGGSCASPRGHLRATYRNFFPPEARWQFSGIRLARDV